jgi:hypothetical protein
LIQAGAKYNIQPNPSKGNITIRQLFAKENGTIKVVVMTIEGKVIYTDNLTLDHGTCHVNMPYTAPGVYFMHITDDQNDSQVFKLLIE